MTTRLVDDTVVRVHHWKDKRRFIELAGPLQDRQGVVLLEDLGGILHAPITPVEVKTARLPGSIPVSVRIEQRILEFATIVTGSNSYEWQMFNRNLLSFFHPEHDSLVVVQTLPWGPRWIKARRKKMPDDPIIEDPTWSLEQLWNWQLVCHDPDWRTRDLLGDWKNNGTGIAAPRVAYRGDRPSFPKFTGNGGTWALTDGPGGPWNPLPTMATGEEWVVDSHPMEWQLKSNKDPKKWEKLQRGFQIPVTEEGVHTFGARVTGNAAAQLQVRLEQRYEYAFG